VPPGCPDHSIFALLYLGAVLVAAVFAQRSLYGRCISPAQGLTQLYLGVIASGAGFFLWNVGARRTNAGTLAVFNNLKIPLAVAVSLLFFGEQTDLVRLCLGGALMAGALTVNKHVPHNRNT
jgi:drug/metabolite transporter (DMT)-like permease